MPVQLLCYPEHHIYLCSLCVTCTGREDLTSQCRLDREAGNIAVHRPVVITADKNAGDVKTAQKDDADGMSYLDDEVSAVSLQMVVSGICINALSQHYKYNEWFLCDDRCI